MFEKIVVQRSRLADQVYEQILGAINSGLIAPSERIVQEKLAEQLQVSRTPIREALFRLEQEGTLVASGRGGFTIRVASRREVAELYQAREAVEGFCAGLLVGADGATLDGIEKIILESETHSPRDEQSYYNANRLIHRAFVSATRNQYLLDMFDAMWNRSLSFGTFRTMGADQLEATLVGHMDLLAEVRNGDAARAEHAMREHIQHGMQLQFSALEKHAAGSSELPVDDTLAS